MTPTSFRRRRGLRAWALGTAGAMVLGAGVVLGSVPAFAATDSTIGDLQADFNAAPTDIVVGANLDAPASTLTLGPNTMTTLHLNGKSLTVQGIELASDLDQDGTTSPSNLTIVGPGTLTVNQTDGSLPAIEVSTGSTLKISSGTISASVPSSSTAAAIGGGPSDSPGPQDSGTMTFNGTAIVSATGGNRGAAIGGGYGGGTAIGIDDNAQVTASVSGGAAAIGAGYGSGTFAISLAHAAHVEAHQNGTGNTGAAIGGGASPTAQTAGSITLGDEAGAIATSAGSGAAIGGGYHGDGGTITASGYSSISATGAQAAIGDGEHSTGSGASMTFSGQGVEITAQGGTGSSGGAGIGGGWTAYGNDSLTVDGGARVTASSANGPAIGGLGNSVPMTVNVNRATVQATGGPASAAVGAGDAASFGTNLTVSDGGSLTVAAGGSAIGGSDAAHFGTLSNSGSVILASGSSWIIPPGATATTSGSFANNGTVTTSGTLSNSGVITNAGTLKGNGSINNSGAIVQRGSLTVPVTGSAFEVVYDGQGGGVSSGTQLVYADSLAAAQLGLPSATPPSAGNFSGWNTAADGTGAALTSTSSLTQVGQGSSAGIPFRFRVYALYQLAPVLPSATALPQGVVGTGYSASIAATTGTNPITYAATGDIPAGLALNTTTGAVSGTPTTAGTFTMHVTARNNAGGANRDFTVQIVPTVLAAVVPSTPKKGVRYLAGGKLDLTLSGFQANEAWTIRVGGRTAASGKAPTNGSFVVHTTVPKGTGDGSQAVVVSGSGHSVAATATVLTASVAKSLGLKLSAKKVKAKKKLTVSVSKLYAGESVRVVISGKHGKTAVGTASKKGGYVLTLKSGLAKGKYTVTVTGAGTGRKASAKLTVS